MKIETKQKKNQNPENCHFDTLSHFTTCWVGAKREKAMNKFWKIFLFVAVALSDDFEVWHMVWGKAFFYIHFFSSFIFGQINY